MISPLRFIISIIILHKLRSIFRKRINHSSSKCITAVFHIFRTLSIQLFPKFITLVCIHGIKIAVGGYPAHIIHRRSDRCLDACINGCCIDGKSSPTTDSHNSNAVSIHQITYRQKIDCCTEIFRIYIGRSYITRFSTAFPCKRRIKSNGQKSPFCHCLSIQT